MTRHFHAPAAALCVAAALLPQASLAQSADTWVFSASIYAFIPTLKASTVFPPSGGSGVGLDSDSTTHISGAFMGSFEARKAQSPWGVFTDLVYADFDSSRSGSRSFQLGGAALPVGASADYDWKLKATAWTIAGTWRAWPDPRRSMDVLLGARMLDIQQKLGWNLAGNIGSIALQDRSGNRETSKTNWDAIMGVKGRVGLGGNGKWFAPYYLDAGFGQSDFTWQVMGGVGYSFSWGDITGSWRYLDYHMKSGSPVQRLSVNGPMIAAVFHW